jgi:hypothetical protein
LIGFGLRPPVQPLISQEIWTLQRFTTPNPS